MVTPEMPPELTELAADFVTRNASVIAEFGKNVLKTASNRVRVRLPNTYKKYIEYISAKYGMSKSFFIRSQPVSIYDFYVHLSIECSDRIYNKVSYQDVSSITTRSIVVGAAGCGKSMLMRHMLLSALTSSSKAPVFVELRYLNEHEISLLSLIYKRFYEYGFDLGEEYLDDAILKGHFIIILDGFDEISHKLRKKVSEEIISLSRRASNCVIMVSSRPDDIFSGWEDFSIMRVCPLNLGEAKNLITKLPCDDDVKNKFLIDMSAGLFNRHKSFLSNPLLLSIMLLTYGMSADIPTKLSIFYNQAYEALFQRHDALKGGFQRDKKCNLDIQDFSNLFSAFCVQTYDKRIFQFSRTDAISYIEKARIAQDIRVSCDDFLEDLMQSVCLLVEDGIFIVFSHRSFQEYFVAKFINESSPKIQRSLIERYWPNMDLDNVIEILYEINPGLVERELMIPKLNEMFEKIGVKKKVGITHFARFMKNNFDGVAVRKDDVVLRREMSRKRNDYYGLLHFVIRNSGYKDIVFTRVNVKESEFIGKYFKESPGMVYNMSEYGVRSDLFKDMSDMLGGGFSVKIIEAALAEKKRLEKKHRDIERSLEELLSR